MDVQNSLETAILKYKQWVVLNPRALHEIESAIKYLSYIFTSELENSNLISELIYALSKLLIFCNDQIIYKANVKQNVSNPYENTLKKWLTVLGHCEVFIEVSAQKLWGTYGKWLMIFIVQTLKSTMRLILLLRNKEQIVEVNPICPLDRKNVQKINFEGTSKPSDSVSLKNGRVIRTIEGASGSRQWKPPSIFTTGKDDQILNKYQKSAEVLYIIKPLVHLGSMYVYGTKSWKPWLLSFLMDIGSLQLMSKKDAAGKQPFSSRQRSELSRRTLSLFLYLIRSPFYDAKTKQTIFVMLNNVSRIPLLGVFAKSINEYVPQWQQTYFYLWSA